ncbi:PASTA domain-containing protein [Brachybacterium sacelli]|uniref:PASTA domain-containing protein n=1 Tax=Brachybacterium sacelli TaxID=173364 RepID=UPI0036163BCC
METSGAECHQAVDKEVADAITWTLQQDLEDPQGHRQGQGDPGAPCGWQDGTSGSQFHTWYVGFTRQMSTAVWFGHPNGNVRPGGFSVDGEGASQRQGMGQHGLAAHLAGVHGQGTRRAASEPFPAKPKDETKSAANQAVQKGVVPDVSGMVLSEAKAALEAAGYSHEVKQEPSGSVGKWYVIGTEPRPGGQAARGRDRGHPPVQRTGLRCARSSPPPRQWA